MYVKQPPDFDDKEFPKYVFELKKFVYGLKQAPRDCYDRLINFLLKNDFKKG